MSSLVDLVPIETALRHNADYIRDVMNAAAKEIETLRARTDVAAANQIEKITALRLYGLTTRQILALIYYYEGMSGKKANNILEV